MSKFLTGTLKNLENKINTNERQKKINKKKKFIALIWILK